MVSLKICFPQIFSGKNIILRFTIAINIKSSQNVGKWSFFRSCFFSAKNNLRSFIFKVSPTTEEIFSEEFFASRDIIVNALDNVEARIYVDE